MSLADLHFSALSRHRMPRVVWFVAAFIGVYAIGFTVFLVAKPVSPNLIVEIDNLLTLAGPVLLLHRLIL